MFDLKQIKHKFSIERIMGLPTLSMSYSPIFLLLPRCPQTPIPFRTSKDFGTYFIFGTNLLVLGI